MRNTFKVLFYIKKNAPLRNGNTPIMGRITINGQRTQLSTQLSVNPNLWDVSMGRAAGRSAVASHVNEQLSQIRFHIERCYNTLFYEHALVTPKMVKEMYFGNDQRNETLLAFFRHHNEEFSRMVGISRSKTTYYKYRCVYKHLEKLRQRQIQPQGFAVQRTRQRVPDGVPPLHRAGVRTQEKHDVDLHDRVQAHPHAGPQPGPHGQGPLRELQTAQRIRRAKLPVHDRNPQADPSGPRRHDLTVGTRCIFVQLLHGTLLHRPLHADPAAYPAGFKQLWISTTRRKTGSAVNVRIFAIPYTILLKYKPMQRNARIFRLPSNGWCNICLERIMSLAGIPRHITFHSARHTFATTITLSQGMAIETISKLLGHKNIRTTQIYATITHSKLDGDMERLSKRLDTLYRDTDLEKVRERL